MILLFSLCAAVCMRLFAGAQTLSDRSRELNAAVAEAESAAEAFKAAKGSAAEAAALTDGARTDGSGFTVDYDESWNPGAVSGAYRLCLAAQDGYADVSVCRTADGETIFALSVKAVG